MHQFQGYFPDRFLSQYRPVIDALGRNAGYRPGAVPAAAGEGCRLFPVVALPHASPNRPAGGNGAHPVQRVRPDHCRPGPETGLAAAQLGATLAITVSISFVLSTLVNGRSHTLYGRFRDTLKRFETDLATEDDPQCPARDVDVLIIGMGRVGSGAYDTVESQYNLRVCGVDTDKSKNATAHGGGAQGHIRRRRGRGFLGGRTDHPLQAGDVHHALLSEMIDAVRQLRLSGYTGKVAAVAKHEDEKKAMKAAGAGRRIQLLRRGRRGLRGHRCPTCSIYCRRSRLRWHSRNPGVQPDDDQHRTTRRCLHGTG